MKVGSEGSEKNPMTRPVKGKSLLTRCYTEGTRRVWECYLLSE